MTEQPAVPQGAVAIPVGDTFALVDAADAELVAARQWRPRVSHSGNVIYVCSGGGNHLTFMHRLIAGTPDGLETDHANGNGLDNRRSNLRIATQSQNRANVGKRPRRAGETPSSQFKGIYWDRSRGKWSCIAGANGVRKHFGRFDDEIEAARAYDRAALAYWGEFALLNFPDEVAR